VRAHFYRHPTAILPGGVPADLCLPEMSSVTIQSFKLRNQGE
jgi:hypothetical protein